MTNRKLPPKEIESIVRRIISYYIDSAQEKNADHLIAYLGGGMIPEATVEVLRPILQRLVDANSHSKGDTLPDAEFDALERLRGEVETLYTKRAATLKLEVVGANGATI